MASHRAYQQRQHANGCWQDPACRCSSVPSRTSDQLIGKSTRRSNAFATVAMMITAAVIFMTMPAMTMAQTPYNKKTYNPAKVDWASVASMCLEVGYTERRLFSHFTRACAHVDISFIEGVACNTCSGIDTALMITAEDITRPESTYDDFATITARTIKKIARFYGTSIPDALAMCCLVAPKGLDSTVDLFKFQKLNVGRTDVGSSNPSGRLPKPDTEIPDFSKFFRDAGLTLEEAAALMGAHGNMAKQSCYRGKYNNPRDFCNVYEEGCGDVKMYQFNNHYHIDACTPDLAVVKTEDLPVTEVYAEQSVAQVDSNVFEAIKREELCKFTSERFRRRAYSNLMKERGGGLNTTSVDSRDNDVFWTLKPEMCADPNSPLEAPMKKNCNHPTIWPYTVTDAHLGMACLKKKTNPTTQEETIGNAMKKFALDNSIYIETFARAMVKMLDVGSRYINDRKLPITGKECPSGLASDAICITAMRGGVAYRKGVTFTPGTSSVPAITSAPADLVTTQADLTAEAFLPDLPIQITSASAPIAGFDPLVNPNAPAGACPTADGQAIEVDGYPASPFKMVPFQEVFKNAEVLKPAQNVCRDASEPHHCMEAYSITIQEFQSELFKEAVPGCQGKQTWMMGYNAMFPGPTIRVKSGTETLVRFSNDIQGKHFPLGNWPCNSQDGRSLKPGRPVSIHCHGMKSLPPYDGWADDVICTNQTKDYIYPNSNPVTAWYHDHAYQVTGPNVYAGMVGFYIVDDSPGCEGDAPVLPYNLDQVEDDLLLAFSDRVIDSSCQLFDDKDGPHRNNLYGDINLVSGIPWPRIKVDPALYRMRMLNAAPTRPYKVQIKNKDGVDVAQKMCWIIGADGGYRKDALEFPFEGLVLGVAERYDVVCDFSEVAGETLYLWNHHDDKLFKGVPNFCFSHLLARFEVSNSGSKAVAFDPSVNPPNVPMHNIIDEDTYAKALAMAEQGKFHRKMEFGRRHGHWVINGETWHTFKIAADDVGQNTWEVWNIKTGGGWFHPIHIHLVDLFILFRNKPGGVMQYEQLSPKDVVYLGPSQKIWVIARFGPHRGDYMFHCHNLVHEDDDMLRAFTVGSNSRLNQNDAFSQLNGVVYYNWGFDNPEFVRAVDKEDTRVVPRLDDDGGEAYVRGRLDANLYSIFYPNKTSPGMLKDAATNPWKSNCKVLSGKKP